MKRIAAVLLTLVLLLPLGLTPALAEGLTQKDLEVIGILMGISEMSEEKSSSNKKKSSSSSRSKTPSSSSTRVTQVTPYNANVKTNGSVLNVRNRPNKGATILTKLKNGSALVVTGYTADQWLKVTANGVTGFVPSRYVTGTPMDEVPYATSATSYTNTFMPYNVIVNPTNNFVNMRTEPNQQAPIKAVFYYGYQLKVMSESNGWCLVLDERNGETGYIMNSMLQRTDYGYTSYGGEQG